MSQKHLQEIKKKYAGRTSPLKTPNKKSYPLTQRNHNKNIQFSSQGITPPKIKNIELEKANKTCGKICKTKNNAIKENQSGELTRTCRNLSTKYYYEAFNSKSSKQFKIYEYTSNFGSNDRFSNEKLNIKSFLASQNKREETISKNIPLRQNMKQNNIPIRQNNLPENTKQQYQYVERDPSKSKETGPRDKNMKDPHLVDSKVCIKNIEKIQEKIKNTLLTK